ncbi:MAG: nitroreductase family protein [Myxococcales bacterium]|nr:nitroreductase family protein [Myxococcales bacterium]
MEKPASAQHELHPLIKNRWSPRSFRAEPLAPGMLEQLLEAARWAASCFNEQPWRYLVARREDAPGFAAMLACLAESNQIWAKNASVLLLAVARTSFTHNDKPNRHALHDVGQASASLSLQATALSLSVHQMAGFDGDRARVTYGIPDGFEPVTAIAIGYGGEPDALPEPLAERERAPRERRALTEIAFAGRWGEPI